MAVSDARTLVDSLPLHRRLAVRLIANQNSLNSIRRAGRVGCAGKRSDSNDASVHLSDVVTNGGAWWPTQAAHNHRGFGKDRSAPPFDSTDSNRSNDALEQLRNEGTEMERTQPIEQVREGDAAWGGCVRFLAAANLVPIDHRTITFNAMQ